MLNLYMAIFGVGVLVGSAFTWHIFRCQIAALRGQIAALKERQEVADFARANSAPGNTLSQDAIDALDYAPPPAA